MTKKHLKLGTWAFALAMLVASCGSGKSDNTVNAGDSTAVSQVDLSGAYHADSTSLVAWRGFKIGGSHDGTLAVSQAEVLIKEGKLYGGYAEIDMNSLKVLDLEGEMAEKLRGHLLNEDFFEVQTYPTARFEFTDIPEEGLPLEGLTSLQGNLTIKAKTKNISIPLESIARDEATGEYTIKTPTFRINRADWDVRYGSSSFFTGLGDKVIDDEIELGFTLKLKK